MSDSTLNFTLLPGYAGKALKLRKDGFIHYCIYKDQYTQNYVKMTYNETETKVSGSVSHILYRLSDIEFISSKTKLPISGYDESTGTVDESSDNDTPGFLTAVVLDINLKNFIKI